MAYWAPAAIDGDGPLYLRLVQALESDIRSGSIRPGTRLPPHRDLAHRLKIGIGTVTRAYAEAEARGLLVARIGSGSFVSEAPPARATAPESGAPVDLARNTLPLGPAAARLDAALARLRSRPDLADHLAYAPAAGFEAHRRAGAAWLERTAGFHDLDWRRLLCCAGAQQALTLAFGALCRPGDRILTECATFYGMKSLAEQAGYALTGLAMDEQGLLPEALDRAGAAGGRVLYTLPTLQNPTGRIMDSERRREIVRVARRHDMQIVEDDVYRIFADDPAIEPLSLLAPERCFYVSGVSKSLAQGLRTGYLVTPPGDAFERSCQVARACSYAPPGFGSLIATQWIEDGSADAIVEEVLAEMRMRTGLAVTILGGAIEAPRSASVPHLWLPMPALDAERLAARGARQDIQVTPPSAPMVGAASETGVRLCLGAVQGTERLGQALVVLHSCLVAASEARMQDVV